MYTIQDLNVRLLSELKEIAEEFGVDNFKKLPKKELIYKILDHQASSPTDEPPQKVNAPQPVQSRESHREHEEKKLIIKRENVKTPVELPIENFERELTTDDLLESLTVDFEPQVCFIY